MSVATVAREAAPAPMPARFPRIALIGNPNTGKTTLFNHLCGLRAKTANFPGTTTAARVGRWRLDEGAEPAEVIDLPGTYRIHLEVPEAEVCRDVLLGDGLERRPDAVVVVVDATNLTRNLYLVGELRATGLPVVVALNMVDLAQKQGVSVDVTGLSERLGCAVVPIVARRGEGIEALRAAVRKTLASPNDPNEVPDSASFESLTAWAQAVAEPSVDVESAGDLAAESRTDRLDRAFTHPVTGFAVFGLVMGGLFWTVFSLATIPMDLIEIIFGVLGGWVAEVMPAGAIRDLLADGIIGGIAGTVVFLPQICLLFFLISLLEDTGYLARAAFVADRVLSRFGLPGQAFVPLLSSHACAIPGILSTRLIPNRRDRLATILVAPFMSCSARLPVYVLLTSLLFEGRPLLAGLAFVGCYLLGALMALVTAFVARRSLLEGRSQPMLLELPSYKWPSLRTATYTALHQGKTFLENAGTVIVGICVVMWWLSAYPKSAPPEEAMALRQQITEVSAVEAEELERQADFLEARHTQAQSFAGRLGRTVQPAFAPLGYDWQLTVGVLTSFLAREVFVSTMAVLLVGKEVDLEGERQGVIARIRSAQRDDGTPVFTLATAASLLVFFVLAMQCLPTLAVTRREAGGWKWAVLQLVYMTAVAWIMAAITYNGLHWMGIVR